MRLFAALVSCRVPGVGQDRYGLNEWLGGWMDEWVDVWSDAHMTASLIDILSISKNTSFFVKLVLNKFSSF